MKYIELKNHIKGSILKQQYLEAFLAQGAYIESMLKMYLDFEILLLGEKNKNNDNIIEALYKKASNFSLFELCKFIYDAKLIDNDIYNKLSQYREKRNKVMHNLLKELRTQDFENQLKDACNLGNEIISSEKLIKIEEVLEIIDKKQEALEKESPKKEVITK